MFSFCISPDLESRSLFKETAKAIPSMKHIHITGSMMEARERLSSGIVCQAIYVSSLFQIDVIREFVSTARDTNAGQDSAFLLMLRTDSDTAGETRSETMGVDGYLFEPYSSDSLREAHFLAQKIHSERVTRRQASAVDVLIGSLITQIDSAALHLHDKTSIEMELKKMRAVSKTLKSLPKDIEEIYFRRLMERFMEAELPEIKPQPKVEQKAAQQSRRVIVKKI